MEIGNCRFQIITLKLVLSAAVVSLIVNQVPCMMAYCQCGVVRV